MSAYNEWPINKKLVSVELETGAILAYRLGHRAGASQQHREVRKALLPDDVQHWFPNYQGGAITRWDVATPYSPGGRSSPNLVLTSQLPQGLLVVELGCAHTYTINTPHFLMVNKYTCTLCGHTYQLDHGD